MLSVFKCWVDNVLHDPGLDFAIREWARRAPDVRRLVDQADDARVAALTEMYRRHEYGDPDAFIRARVLYFMQTGYYALEMQEPLDLRLSYLEAYLRSFASKDASAKELRRFRKMAVKLANSASPHRGQRVR